MGAVSTSWSSSFPIDARIEEAIEVVKINENNIFFTVLSSIINYIKITKEIIDCQF